MLPLEKKSHGFILVATLATLLLLTLLALSISDTSVLLMQQANNQWQYWKIRVAINQTNHYFIQQLSQSSKLICEVNYSESDNYWHSPAMDWGQGCQIEKMKIKTQTVVELLPQALCVQEKNTTKKINFLRITTATIDTALNLHVQINMTQMVNQACVPNTSQLSLGLQSWRME